MNLSLFLRLPSIVRPLTVQNSVVNLNTARLLHVSGVDLRARKGTREKARKKKGKKVVQERVYIPKRLLLEKKRRGNTDLHATDEHKPIAIDDVYSESTFRKKIFGLTEAVLYFREVYHPTVYNDVKAPIFANIELNMQGEKKTKFKEGFTKTALIPHPFKVNDYMTILALSKSQQLANNAIDGGATHAGGLDVIKKIQAGEIKPAEFEHILAHPDILSDLLPIRGLLKKKFPSEAIGTVSEDLLELLAKYRSSVKVEAKKDFIQVNFGSVLACFGYINMDPSHLEANLSAILDNVNSVRPKRAGPFITRVYIQSPPYKMHLKIDPFLYVSQENISIHEKKSAKKPAKAVVDEDSDSDEDEPEKAEGVVA